jgi:3-hydroxybutyryl-CoA dehydrogenase
VAVEPVTRIGVVGAGFMGSGIAQSAVTSGLEVVLHEPEEAPLTRSRERHATWLTRDVERGKLTEAEAEAIRGRLTYSTDLDALAGVDAVIEAIIEDARAKGRVFAKLDEQLPEARLLASNTSSIPLAEIAAWTQHPDRVVGLHFFSPVPVMSLVEIVVGLDTSDATHASAEALVSQLGKHSVTTKDRSGFIVNMLLVPYLMAAVRMLEDGFASREDIDEGMKRGCGHPMGPLTLCDFIGLDVLYAVCDSLYEEFKQAEYAPPPLLKRMVISGRHGRKTGRGFYEYPDR